MEWENNLFCHQFIFRITINKIEIITGATEYFDKIQNNRYVEERQHENLFLRRFVSCHLFTKYLLFQ